MVNAKAGNTAGRIQGDPVQCQCVDQVRFAVGVEAGHDRRNRVGDEVVGESEHGGGAGGLAQSGLKSRPVGRRDTGRGTESSRGNGDLFREPVDNGGRVAGSDRGSARSLERVEETRVLVQRVDRCVDLCAGVLPLIKRVHGSGESRVALYGLRGEVLGGASDTGVRDSGKIEGELLGFRAGAGLSVDFVADGRQEPHLKKRKR